MSAARRDLIVSVSRCQHIEVNGDFHRHASLSYNPVSGSLGGGRWGPPDTYPVLYLGRPPASVVVEAYRHLVEPFPDMTADLVQPRRMVTVRVAVTNVLDLTAKGAWESLGLSDHDLHSRVGDYRSCWGIARAAHQLGLHGILAPAATGIGDTLALFEDHLPASELPQLTSEEQWSALPADPRRLRLVQEESQ